MKHLAALTTATASLAIAAGCSSPKGPTSTDPTTDGGGGGAASCDPVITKVGFACSDAEALRAATLLRAMTLDEKVQQMSGPAYNPNNMFDQEDSPRMGIPGYRFMDGPRGVRWYNSDYGTTVYPVAAARASSWNVELERRIGKAMADEMRDLGRHVLLAPTINQVMHPRWGRAQETYGEDSYLLGEMGSAFIRGAQYDPSIADPLDPAQPIDPSAYRIQACAKHLAANNIEDTRIYVNAVLDERTMREVYLPHFKKASAAGVSCVMASYNRVNGTYSGYSKALVRDILKNEWGFHGWVVSDWFAKGATLTSPVAGLDVEMPFSSGSFPSIFDSAYFYGTLLSSAVQNGTVDAGLVDEAAFRILYAKVHFGVIDKWNKATNWSPWLTKSEATQALALESARQGVVLLKNGPSTALADDVLPLNAQALKTIAVVGKFANSENMGDKGSSDAKVVDSSLVITPYEGLAERLGAANASPSSCAGASPCAMAFETVSGHETALAAADVIFVVGAYYPADLARSSTGEEGEWKDRVSMSLPQRDLDNIAAAVALRAQNPNLKIVVVMKSGGAVVVNPWIANADAVLMAWFAGMKEGTALAEIVFGDVSPSGKVVQSFPAEETDLPAFPNTAVGDVSYSYYHGYRWLDVQGKAARWPFGFGLSYTTFAYSNLVVPSPTVAETGALTVSVDVTNTGTRPGSEVVQLYVGYPNSTIADTWGRPKKELKAFARVADLAPGAKQTVTLTVNASDLGYWNIATKRTVVEHVAHTLWVGPSSDLTDPNTQTATFTVQ